MLSGDFGETRRGDEEYVGAGEVGAVEMGVEGGGVLLAESAAELPDVMDSGRESIVGVRWCIPPRWKIEGWMDVMESVRSSSRETLSGGGISDGENERCGGGCVRKAGCTWK